jgi:hypothetical protein
MRFVATGASHCCVGSYALRWFAALLHVEGKKWGFDPLRDGKLPASHVQTIYSCIIG